MTDTATGDALQSFLQMYSPTPQSDVGHIPASVTQCCCGNEHCAYLEHNQTALDDLERELQTSARLGQALLVRHETYMADAERQRQMMAQQMEDLESEKKTLQAKNNDLVQENRGLLDQLEALNNAVSESDASITSLQATLQSAQQEIMKLSLLAARTENLERELLLFEQEQATWQASLSAKETAERTAMRRWHDAERTLAKLQAELERIERESREERERHSEVVARMERRHAVEKELVGAENRLKGAASTAKDGSVVSHFVKDILSDNATLQMGIVELRDMLQNSNEEVEKLRDQLLLHQPVEQQQQQQHHHHQQQHQQQQQEDKRPVTDRSVSLGDELDHIGKSQELHVHHHYHAPTPAPVQRSNSLRRTKKKPVQQHRFPSGSSVYFSPTSSGRSTPRSSISLGPGTSAAAILRQTAVSLPQDLPQNNNNRRWSAQSSLNQSSAYQDSVPSSPTTTNRTSSIFDKVFSDADPVSASPPTSDGEGFNSPYFAALETRRPSSIRKLNSSKGHARGWGPGKQSLDSILDISVEDLPPPLEHAGGDQDNTIQEESPDWEAEAVAMDAWEQSEPVTSHDDSTHDYMDRTWQRPVLRRAASHESLLSVSGMDIHTLKSRPSQLLIPNALRTTGAVVSSLQVHAAKAESTAFLGSSSKSLLSGMAADQRKVSAPTPARQGLTKKSSGWFFGRWGTTPDTTTSEEAAPTRATFGSRRTSSIASSNSDNKPAAMPKVVQVRTPGINQTGPIFGFLPETKITHPPVLKSLDQAALTNVLDPGH